MLPINDICCYVLVYMFGLTVISLTGSEGFCFIGKLMADMTVSRRIRYYCEYSQDGQVLKLFPGSNLVLVDHCMDCKCSFEGLQCCGFGHAAGTVGFPDDCKLLLDGCQPLIVKTANEGLDCMTGKAINFTALSEQLPHPDNTYKPLKLRKPKPPVHKQVTTPEPAPVQTTTAKPKRASTDGMLASAFADYLRQIMAAGASAHPPQLTQPYLNEIILPPATQPPPPLTAADNYWQHDIFMPWFWFA